jgi:hypothetical protein
MHWLCHYVCRLSCGLGLQVTDRLALGTTEAEYIALSQAMHNLIPLLGLLDELAPALHLEKDQPLVYWKACDIEPNSRKLFANLYEDYTGAYKFAKAPKM